MISITSIIPDIRVRIRDEGKIEIGNDDVLIPFINEAIIWVSSQLITLGDPSMIVEIDIADNSIVPIDFIKFVGQHPLSQTGSKFKILDGSNLVSARYWASKPRITAVTDSVDFPDQYHQSLIQYTAIVAMNKLGKPIQQDTILLKQLNGTIAEAEKG